MAKPLKYLIFGNGYVANYLQKHMKGDITISSERISEYYQVSSEIIVNKPDVIINCIGRTGNPNVDWCESHKEETFEANVRVAQLIKQACKDHKKPMIHISTGCIFTGLAEDNSEPNFYGSFYSRTKAMAEDIVGEYDKAVILRIRLLISEIDSPRNILCKVKKFTNVTNVPTSMTFLKDLAKVIPFVIRNNMWGPINVVHPELLTIESLSMALNTNATVVKQKELQIGKRAEVVLHPMRLEEKGFVFVDNTKELMYCANELKDE